MGIRPANRKELRLWKGSHGEPEGSFGFWTGTHGDRDGFGRDGDHGELDKELRLFGKGATANWKEASAFWKGSHGEPEGSFGFPRGSTGTRDGLVPGRRTTGEPPGLRP
jgi:hypothetical protein